MISFVLFFSVFTQAAFALLAVPNLPNNGVMTEDNNSAMDPKIRYSNLMGRITDKDKSGHILKIKVENNNIRFFKAGDQLSFKINNQEREYACQASVRKVEDFYLVVYVNDLNPCWGRKRYFPRGMQINIESPVLSQRTFEASEFRNILILKKDGYLKQLNDINKFLWSYNQQKIDVVADFDKQINELIRQKQLALDNLLKTKQENLILQSELMKKLDSLNDSLKHYRVDRNEYLSDRWNLDQDLGLPVSQRPQKLK